jgi:hypothetical protein
MKMQQELTLLRKINDDLESSLINLLYGGMMAYLHYIENNGVQKLLDNFKLQYSEYSEFCFKNMIKENINPLSNLMDLYYLFSNKIIIKLSADIELSIFTECLKCEYFTCLQQNETLKTKLSEIILKWSLNNKESELDYIINKDFSTPQELYSNIWETIQKIIGFENYFKFFNEFIEELNKCNQFTNIFDIRFFNSENINQSLIEEAIYNNQ